jgi:hypothetical protein
VTRIRKRAPPYAFARSSFGRAAEQLLLLVVAVDHQPFARQPGAERELELTCGRDVRAESLLREQPQHGDRWERLRPVGDQRARSGGAIGLSLCAQRLLVVDDERRAEPARELRRRHAAECELTVLDGGGVREKVVE